MKLIFAKILEGLGNEVYATRRIERPHFTTEFHFHEEAQLTYVIEGEGRRMVGDSIENFYSDELTLIGANLPHVWHNDKQPNAPNAGEAKARSAALFFHPENVIQLLSKFIDTTKLKRVFSLAQRGMLFYGLTKDMLKQLLLEMSHSEDWEKLKLLIQVFEILCVTTEFELLVSSGYNNTYQVKDNDRIDKVFKFVFDNYATEIELKEVAALVHMNKQAFCRYFKNRTQKTFVSFVNEVRIAQACKLMAQDNYAINAVASKCGYNSLSHFNRFFKEIMGVTPKAYKDGLL